MKINIEFLKTPENKQKILFAVLGVVGFLTAYVIYSNFFAKPQALVTTTTPTAQVLPTSGIMLNVDILKNEIFQALEKIGEYPLTPSKNESIGRDNPFIPY